MIQRLYPRLPLAVARELATRCCTGSREQAEAMSALEDQRAIYAPIGGTRATPQQLEELRHGLVEVARDSGYPTPPTREGARSFDSRTAALLHRQMSVSPHEASQAGIWQFLCCVLVPGLVHWRFPSEGPDGSLRRYLGGVRNALGRLWWRAFILYDETHTDPYHLVSALFEDETVQIMERPTMAGCRALALATAKEFLRYIDTEDRQGFERSRRMVLMRESQKRMMRIFPILAIDFLGGHELEKIARATIAESAILLRRQRVPLLHEASISHSP